MKKSKMPPISIIPQPVVLLEKSHRLRDNLKLSHKKHIFRPVFFFLVLSYLFLNTAHASWYDQKLEGWYYFEDIQTAQKNKPITPEEADEFILTESLKLKQLLSLAIIDPTTENVEKYIRAQRLWVLQSSTFAQTWGKTLLEHPELSESLTTPTSSYGILAKRTYDLQKRKALLQKLSQNYFMMFFFNGDDPLSQKAAEVVQLFASANEWKYKAVSLDGKGLSSLKDYEIDKGISKPFKVQAAPSFFIVNPTDNQVYPVGAGLISVSTIEQNIETQLEGLENGH